MGESAGGVDRSRRGLLRSRGMRGSRITATADTKLVSLGGSATRERGGAMFVRTFVFFVGIMGGGAASFKTSR